MACAMRVSPLRIAGKRAFIYCNSECLDFPFLLNTLACVHDHISQPLSGSSPSEASDRSSLYFSSQVKSGICATQWSTSKYLNYSSTQYQNSNMDHSIDEMWHHHPKGAQPIKSNSHMCCR